MNVGWTELTVWAYNKNDVTNGIPKASTREQRRNGGLRISDYSYVTFKIIFH